MNSPVERIVFARVEMPESEHVCTTVPPIVGAAMVKSHVVGTLIGDIRFNLSGDLSTPDLLSPAMELYTLHTEKGLRGLGIGRQLIEASALFAHGVGCEYIRAHNVTPKAAQLLTRYGFERAGTTATEDTYIRRNLHIIHERMLESVAISIPHTFDEQL